MSTASPWAPSSGGPTDEWTTPAEALVLPSVESATRNYPNLGEWVTKWLADIYRVPTDTAHRSWCPQWWRHGGAVYRLRTMWDAWEVAETEGGAAPFDWLLAADLHMDKLLATDGPFKGCSQRQGHLENTVPPLWQVPPPPEWSQPTPEPLDAAGVEVPGNPPQGLPPNDHERGDA